MTTDELTKVYDRALVLRTKLAQNQAWRRKVKAAGRDSSAIDARISQLTTMLAALGGEAGKDETFFVSHLSIEEIADQQAQFVGEILMRPDLYPGFQMPAGAVDRAWAHIQADPAQGWSQDLVDAVQAAAA